MLCSARTPYPGVITGPETAWFACRHSFLVKLAKNLVMKRLASLSTHPALLLTSCVSWVVHFSASLSFFICNTEVIGV